MMRHIGIVRGKGNSRRLFQKNRQLVGGMPLIEHAANTLKHSRILDRVVLSTDSDEMASIAEGVDSIDKTYVRAPDWEDGSRMGPEIPALLKHIHETENIRYDTATCISGNVLFIRPSWVRVAMDILLNHRYLDDNISAVTNDKTHFDIVVYRIRPFGDLTPLVYEFPHSGILVDIDYSWDLKLAREIFDQIKSENIKLPYDESIHEQVFADANPNHMRGLKRIT